MIPLRDSEEIETFPLLTIAIIVINVVVFLFMRFSANAKLNPELALASFYYRFGLIPYTMSTGEVVYDSVRPYGLTLITSIFLHGSYSHIIFNMLFLWIFGNNIEDYFGHVFFLIFYIVAGIFASFTQILTKPSSQIPVIGASGAIAGIMGAYFFLFRKARIKSLVFLFYFVTVVEVPAFLYLLIWFLMQIFSGITSFNAASGVAFWAHIGGFVFGAVVAVFYKAITHGRRESSY